MHVFEQMVEQAAEGAAPAQLAGGVHVDVVDTVKQESASVTQVATVWPSWHTAPGWVQIEAGHVHAAVPFDTKHI